MKMPAMELSMALDLAYALGALDALGQKTLAVSLRGNLDALMEQAWAEEADKQSE